MSYYEYAKSQIFDEKKNVKWDDIIESIFKSDNKKNENEKDIKDNNNEEQGNGKDNKDDEEKDKEEGKKKEKEKTEISVGGSCDLKGKCSLMATYCLKLFNLKIKPLAFPVPLFPYLELAVSIIPSIKAEICVGIGSSFDLNGSYNSSFDVDVSGGASVGVTLDLGVFFPSYNSPITLSFNIGMNGIMGSAKVGVKLSLFSNNIFSIDLYAEFKAFEFSFYVMFRLTFKFTLGPFMFNFSFSFYIYNKTFFGFKYEYHNEQLYNKCKFVQRSITSTKNGQEWWNRKRDRIITKENC